MHSHEETLVSRKHITLALTITAAFFVVELVGGYVTNSLALSADAWHMLNDIFALAFALTAAWVSVRPNDMKKTYGYYRAEILAAFLNGIFLWAIVAFIFYNAVERLWNPVTVASSEVLVIAVTGLAVNGLSAVILSRSQSRSFNVRGAFLHVVSDTLGSVAVIAAAVIMFLTGWYQADPVFSMAVAVLIFYGAFKLVRESVHILLEGVPPGIEIDAVEKRIRSQKGIRDVHDLHVWCMTPSQICALSCHVVIDKDVDRRMLTSDLIVMLEKEFGIDHTTIQLEEEGYPKANQEH